MAFGKWLISLLQSVKSQLLAQLAWIWSSRKPSFSSYQPLPLSPLLRTISFTYLRCQLPAWRPHQHTSHPPNLEAHTAAGRRNKSSLIPCNSQKVFIQRRPSVRNPFSTKGGFSLLFICFCVISTFLLSAGTSAHQTGDIYQRDGCLLSPSPTRPHFKNAVPRVVAGALRLLNFTDLLGLEKKNTVQSQQGWAVWLRDRACGTKAAGWLLWRHEARIMPC